jgi:hypothetical protein
MCNYLYFADKILKLIKLHKGTNLTVVFNLL